MTNRSLLPGLSAIAMAIIFNVPYVRLALIYDYPAILRRPAAEALDRFAAGGADLILTWHSFAWTALLLVPLGFVLALSPRHVAAAPGLAIAAAITGALAGITQAIGLWRWVFVVPAIAHSHALASTTGWEREAAEHAFDLLNRYGGMAIGEHLGQLLTALFVAQLAALQWRTGVRVVAVIGHATAAAIAAGTTEGPAIVLGMSGAAFSLATVAGFLGLTLWLMLTGAELLGAGRPLSRTGKGRAESLG